MATYLNGNEINIITLGDNIDVDKLVNRISKLENKLSNYMAKVLVTVQDSVVEYFVEKGKTLDITNPIIEGYTFEGWFIDDVSVDLSSYIFNTDTNIYAKLTFGAPEIPEVPEIPEEPEDSIAWVCNLDDFEISDTHQITSYTGTDEYVELPSTYSLETRETQQDGPMLTDPHRISMPFEQLVIKTADGVEHTIIDPVELYEYYEPVSLISIRCIPDYLSDIMYELPYPLTCNGVSFNDMMSFREYLWSIGTWEPTDFIFGGTITTTVKVPGTDYTITGINSLMYNKCVLKGIKIPASIVSISMGTITSYNTLEKIVVDKDNTVFDSRDNCNAIIGTSQNVLYAGCKNTVIPSSVNMLWDEAFRGCTNLTSIIIPDNITNIRMRVFQGCTSLQEIVIPGSVPKIWDSAFDSCTSLKKLTICEGVQELRFGAFINCTSLESIHIPASLTLIDGQAFSYIQGVTSITVDENNTVYDSRNNCNAIIETNSNTLLFGCINTIIPEGVEHLGKSAFLRIPIVTITLPNTLKTIGIYAFQECKNLISIVIPDSVTDMSDGYTFKDCTALETVILGKNVSRIGRFEGCTSLKSIEIPASVTSTVWSVFKDCTSLTSVTFAADSNLTSIGGYGFQNCTSLTEITIPKSVTTLDTTSVFAGCTNLKTVTFEEGSQLSSIPKYCFSDCAKLETVNIPDTVRSFGDGAFDDCAKLTTVNIPVGVTSLPWRFCTGCSTLNNVTLPEGLTTINSDAFWKCSSLTSITLPSTLTSIASRAFQDCTKLATVINHSSLVIAKDTQNGHVGYYATSITNTQQQ